MGGIAGWGALIIGDEIMRGRRQDRHFSRVVEILAGRGLHLDWATYIADDHGRLSETLRRTMASGDALFSFGGIGVTPDDHTRQAAAEAAGVPLTLHPDAETEIRARFAESGAKATPQRLQLGEFPVGSRIIPNPYNRIPGFSLRDHHFFPGFPEMAWPMLEWVLETYYRKQFHAAAEAVAAIIVWEGSEGTLLDLMRRIEADYPQASLFSLPSFGSEGMRRHIELGMRGDPSQVNAAMAEIRDEVSRLGYAWEEKR
ncbi:MAG: molybdopterin-binding protein [Sterolibacterium sp.]|jgi:molybdopterin-biosynthesis enzyme MoeA-like protein